MKAFDFLAEYYENYNEEERLTSRHGQVEFLTTMEYIKKYLSQGIKILEVGAGTGKYSHTLARMGYEVDAVELVQSNIDILKSKISPDEILSVVQGDALDLSDFSDETYDMVLLLGPMYHLFTEEDQRTAISEALRVTKKGGCLFASYCISDASIIEYGFKKENINLLIEKGLLDTEEFIAKSNPEDLFRLCRKSDIDRLMAEFNVERLNYVATDLATNFMRETVDLMDDDTFDIYLKYHFKMCEREDLVGATHHSLDIIRKL